MPKLSLNASKKTKHTPAGEIPVDWGWSKIGALGNVQTGRQKSPSFIKGSVRPYLRVANVFEGRLSLEDVKSMKFTDAEYEQFLLKNGDILLNEGQSLELVGRAAMYKGKPANCCFQNTLIRFQPGESITPEFSLCIFHFFLHTGKFAAIASQTTSIAHLGTSRFAALPAPVPPLPEQRRIADILSIWDRAIETLESIIAAKDSRKQALMQQLLTGKKRLPGFTDPWPLVSLGTVFKERKERNCNDLKLLSITAKQGVVDRDTLEKRDSSNEDKSKYLRIAPGDIGYNTMRMWQGVAGLSLLEGIISPAYTVITPTAKIDGEFASQLFKLPSMIFLFWRHSQGLVDDTLMLKYPAFSRIRVHLPKSVKEQKAITAVLSTTDRELTVHRQHLESLRTQKRGLMQLLLTGEVRTTRL